MNVPCTLEIMILLCRVSYKCQLGQVCWFVIPGFCILTDYQIAFSMNYRKSICEFTTCNHEFDYPFNLVTFFASPLSELCNKTHTFRSIMSMPLFISNYSAFLKSALPDINITTSLFFSVDQCFFTSNEWYNVIWCKHIKWCLFLSLYI